MPFEQQENPFDWETIHDAIFDWFNVSTALPNIVWANQDIRQPPYPYGTLSILSGPIAQAPQDEYRREMVTQGSETYLLNHTGNLYQIVVSANVFVGPPDNANPDSNAISIMARAKAALGVREFITQLSEAGIGIVEGMAIQQLDFVQDAKWVSRAQMDVMFTIAGNVTDKTSEFVETAPLTADIEDATGADVDDALLIQNVS